MTNEFLPIPPIETATDPVHSPADLRQRWRALMGELGFGDRRLWIGFIGPDRRMIKALSQLPLGPRPKRGRIEPTMAALVDLLSGMPDGTTVALLLTRPGSGPISDADRQWSAVLTEVAAELDLPIEPVFRANADALLLVEPRARAA